LSLRHRAKETRTLSGESWRVEGGSREEGAVAVPGKHPDRLFRSSFSCLLPSCRSLQKSAKLALYLVFLVFIFPAFPDPTSSHSASLDLPCILTRTLRSCWACLHDIQFDERLDPNLFGLSSVWLYPCIISPQLRHDRLLSRRVSGSYARMPLLATKRTTGIRYWLLRRPVLFDLPFYVSPYI
jgi:hypothetical protein